jgi:hypothetical protein
MKKKTEQIIVFSKITIKELSETELLEVTGGSGATEELFGAYHF